MEDRLHSSTGMGGKRCRGPASAQGILSGDLLRVKPWKLRTMDSGLQSL